MSASTATAPAAPAAAPAAPAAKKMPIQINHTSNAIFLSQVALFCLYGGCTTFDSDYNSKTDPTTVAGNDIQQLPMHVFVGLFVFLGLGFLFIQNARFSWQSVGYTLAIGVSAVQWAILCGGFWAQSHITRTTSASGWNPIALNTSVLLNSLYITATVLISYSVLAGRVSFAQAFFISWLEVFFAAANFQISIEMYVLDVGGTFSVHLFGAAFGLFASLVIGNKLSRDVTNQPRTKSAGTFALLGLVVLFVTFPVFNAANVPYLLISTFSAPPALAAAIQGASTTLMFRGYFNTVMAMAASITGAFMVSKANNGGTKFNFWQIQNAAIAGGAASGAVNIFLPNPFGAIMLGAVAGIISVWGQTTLTPWLAKMRFVDTSGVLSGHLLPAVCGAFATAIAVGSIEIEDFNTNQLAFMDLSGRTSHQQGGQQIAFAVVSLGFGLLSGIFVGLLANYLPVFNAPAVSNADDEDCWDGIEAGGVTATANPVAKTEKEAVAAN
jgi:ammonium transporter Rh